MLRVSLILIVSLRPSWAARDLVSKKKKPNIFLKHRCGMLIISIGEAKAGGSGFEGQVHSRTLTQVTKPNN